MWNTKSAKKCGFVVVFFSVEIKLFNSFIGLTVFAFRPTTTRTVAASKTPWDIGMRQEQNWRLAAQWSIHGFAKAACEGERCSPLEGLLGPGHTYMPTWKIYCYWMLLADSCGRVGLLFAIRVLSSDMSWWLSTASQTCYLQDCCWKFLNLYCLPGISWSAVTSKVASATSGSHSGLHDVGSADWRKSGERDPIKVESRTILSLNTSLSLCFFLWKFEGPLASTLMYNHVKIGEFSMDRCVLLFKPCSQYHHP